MEYCCSGCRTVSEIILKSGNSRFYDYRGSEKLNPAEIPAESSSYFEYLDSDLVREDYLQSPSESSEDPNQKEAIINIQNIHCSACVWLNEKSISQLDGVSSVRISFATGRAVVRFSPDIVPLSQIFRLIQSLGYEPKLYSPHLRPEKTKQSRNLLMRLGIAGFCFGNIMLFGTSLYAGYFTGIEVEWKRLLHYLSWAFATPAYFYSGFPFLRGAWNSLKMKKLSMDVLLVTGISMAYFYSIYVTFTDQGEVYFDSVCMIYFFILLGKYFEERSRIQATEKIGFLLEGLPDVCTKLDQTSESEIIKISRIQVGDRILVRSGERVPVDGSLESQIGYMDESFLSGESRPVTKQKGDAVLSGSLVSGDPIVILASSVSRDSTLSRLRTLIEKAVSEKPKLEKLTDKISTYFIGVVFLISLGTFLFWISESLETAIINTIAVLIVACPCALGLSVPTALVVNHIKNSRRGILLKDPNGIEPLSRLDRIYFDKTGTLTEGKLVLESVQFKDPTFAAEITVALEGFSTHPIAKTLIKVLPELYPIGLQSDLQKDTTSEFHPSNWKNISEIPGRGIQGECFWEGKNRFFQIGSANFLNAWEHTLAGPHQIEIFLGMDGEILGSWIFSDRIRAEAEASLREIQNLGIQTWILSGDRSQTVGAIAKNLSIRDFCAEKLPNQKLEEIQNAQKKGQIVAMVGDGMNDGAALAQADLGISMGIASDLSLDKSDVVLVRNDLSSLPFAIKNARETNKIIIQNIGISFCYNSVMLPLSAMGFMAPVLCAALMALSSLTVVGNSLRFQALDPD
jgi:Cu+-exporting ATPase